MNTEIAARLSVDTSGGIKSVKDFRNELRQAENDYKILKETAGETNEATKRAAQQVEQLKKQLADASETTKSFKTRLREAEQELIKIQQKFGATSKEALAAAKNIAAMRDQMKEAKEVADLFDPGAKFQVFGNVLRTVTGGFSALTGTLALFGAESEEVEKSLLKVQAALAITEGVNTIVDSAKDFQRLKDMIANTAIAQKTYATATTMATAITKALGLATNTTSTGFKVLRGAIISTGIGALVVGIGMLIANFDKVKEALFKFLPGLETAANFIGNLIQKITDFIGITSEAARQSEKAMKDLETAISAGERFLDLNADKYDQYTQRKFNADLDYKKKKLALMQDEKLSEADRNKFIQQAEDQRSRLINKATKDRADAEQKIAEDKMKKAQDAYNAAAQKEKEALDGLRQLQEENYLASIKDETERAKAQVELQYKTEVKKTQVMEASAETKTKRLVLLEIKKNRELKDIQDKFDKQMEEGARVALENLIAIQNEKKEQEKSDFIMRIENARGNIQAEYQVMNELRVAQMDEIEQQRLDEVYQLGLWYAERKKVVQAGSEAEVLLNQEMNYRMEQLERQSFNARLGVIIGFLAKGADLLGKQTTAGKVLAVASATINTYVAASDALKANYGMFGPFAQVARFAAVAATIATGLKQVKEIVKVKVPGGGGSMPSMPSTSDISAPLSPRPQIVQTNTTLDQGSINDMGNAAAPVRAFVVEQDVENNRERITRLSRSARLGG